MMDAKPTAKLTVYQLAKTGNSSSIKVRHLVTPPHKTISWRWHFVGVASLVLIIGGCLTQFKVFQFTRSIKLSTPFSASTLSQEIESDRATLLPSPILQSSSFQVAISKATQAAERTQTAKNREDWQQVSNLWRAAIDYLEQVTPTDSRYALSQKKLIEYQHNFVYAQQQFQRIPKPVGLEITKQSIQSIFEASEMGFRFHASTPIDKYSRVMGQSPDGLAMLELIGTSADLAKVTIVVGLPSDNASATALNRSYMLKLLQHMFPTWNHAPNWLTESTLQLTDGYTGDLIMIRDNKRIKLSAIGDLGTLVLVIEPN